VSSVADSRRDWVWLGALTMDAVLLAIVELFFLPLRFGVVEFPITALLAALTTPLLVAWAGAAASTPLVAGLPLWAWLLTIAVFGIGGPGGDIVLLADWRSLLLLGAGVLPSAIVLGRLRVS
jgi:hypothetical protein